MYSLNNYSSATPVYGPEIYILPVSQKTQREKKHVVLFLKFHFETAGITQVFVQQMLNGDCAKWSHLSFSLTLQSQASLTFHLSLLFSTCLFDYLSIAPCFTETFFSLCSSHKTAAGAEKRACDSVYIVYIVYSVYFEAASYRGESDSLDCDSDNTHMGQRGHVFIWWVVKWKDKQFVIWEAMWMNSETRSFLEYFFSDFNYSQS